MPRSLASYLLVITVVVLAAARAPVAQTPAPAGQRPVDFAADIQPLLAANCLSCHGETLKLSRLDLRTRDSAIEGGAHGPSLVPGSAERSRIYRHVAGLESPAMPMRGAPLSAGGRRHAEALDRRRRALGHRGRGRAVIGVRGGGDRGAANHRRRAQLLGVPAAAAGAAARRRSGDFPSGRPLPRAGATQPRPGRRARRRSPHPGPPGLSRSARAAAVAGRGRRLRRRHPPRRVGAADRHAAGLAALRRTLRPALARRGPLCRFGRLRVRRPPAQRLALPRLRDQGVQRRHALRPVPRRTDRRRRDRRPLRRQPGGHRLPARRAAGAVPREGQPGTALRLSRRRHRRDRQGHAGADHRLRAVPRPQVRSDPAEGLLRAAGVDLRLRRDRGAAGAEAPGRRLPGRQRGARRPPRRTARQARRPRQAASRSARAGADQGALLRRHLPGRRQTRERADRRRTAAGDPGVRGGQRRPGGDRGGDDPGRGERAARSRRAAGRAREGAAGAAADGRDRHRRRPPVLARWARATTW